MAVSPWTELIRERVEQGPVSYDSILAEASSLVPPGRAYRVALGAMESESRRGGYSGHRSFTNVEAKKDQRIRYGQRAIVAGIVHSMHVRGRLMSYEQGGVRMLTIGPHPWTDPLPPKQYATEMSKGILEAVRDDSMEVNDLFEHVKHLAPRGQAIELAIRKRTHGQRYRKNPSATLHDEQRFTDEHNFGVGARDLFAKSLRSLAKSKRIVIVGPSSGSRIIYRGPNWVDPNG